MRASRVFVEQPLAVGDAIELSGLSAHYLRNVLRLKAGADIILFNGGGGEYSAQIQSVERGRVGIKVIDFDDIDRNSPCEINLGIAVIKRDAMDNVMQKATELGVASIAPLITSFTATVSKSLDKRQAHWQQVIRSACEQCGRNIPPHLRPVSDFHDWARSASAPLKIIAHPGVGTVLSEIDADPASIDLLIGPEGGFDEDEIALAEDSGFQAVSLGPRILRADTAPIALLSLLQARWGDLR